MRHNGWRMWVKIPPAHIKLSRIIGQFKLGADMGKRKDNYRNMQNAKLLSNIRWSLKGAEYSVQAIEAVWYKYFQNKDIMAVEWLRESLKNISKDVDEIEKRLPSDAVRVIPKNERATKGKGKLNLHETDRELRDSVKVERYNQNT